MGVADGGTALGQRWREGQRRWWQGRARLSKWDEDGSRKTKEVRRCRSQGAQELLQARQGRWSIPRRSRCGLGGRRAEATISGREICAQQEAKAKGPTERGRGGGSGGICGGEGEE